MGYDFFNGFLAVLFPDSVFKKSVNAKTAFSAVGSLSLSSVFLVGVGLFGLKTFVHPNVEVTFLRAVAVIFGLWVMLIFLTAAMSWFLNSVYAGTIRIKGKPLDTDFFGNFLCRSYVIPWWVGLGFFYIAFLDRHESTAGILVFVLGGIRLLDIEARLVKVVYKLRLIQGYAVVFVEVLFIAAGMIVGSLLFR
ncbi:MAG: hypothetical protein PHO30_07680 [Candidatus Omnitrophica bacterium]|jgi:hypothetical protein|nr:hypothetical protein [Candidatus Omnitrophota bacterium]